MLLNVQTHKFLIYAISNSKQFDAIFSKISASFSCACPVFDSEVHHNIVKFIVSPQPHDSVMTKFMISNITGHTHKKTVTNLLIWMWRMWCLLRYPLNRTLIVVVVYFSVVITVNLLLYSSLLVYQEPYTFLSKELKLQQNYDALNSQGEEWSLTELIL